MIPPSAHDLLLGIQSTLGECGFDYEQTIKDFGQVSASEARLNGHAFDFRDHLRGLLLSQLSNRRPWKAIALEPPIEIAFGGGVRATPAAGSVQCDPVNIRSISTDGAKFLTVDPGPDRA